MSKCRSCGAEILWAKTLAGRSIPLDSEPTEKGNIIFEDGLATVCATQLDLDNNVFLEVRYVPHFTTCPEAAQWRKK